MQNQKSVWGLPLRQQVISLALSGNCLWATLGVSAGVIGAIAQTTPVQAAILTQWQFNSTTNQLEITVPEGTQPRYFLLAKPARIVLDLPNTQMGSVPTEQTLSGPVQQIRVSQQQAGSTRIVMQLAPNVVFAPGQVKLEQAGTGKAGTRWVLRPLIAGSSTSTPTVAAKPAAPATVATKPQSAAPTPPSVQPSAPAASSTQRSQPSPPAVTNERSQPSPPAVTNERSQPTSQPSPPAVTNERSQPTTPAAPRSRITRNAADLLAPGDRSFDNSSAPSPESSPTIAAPTAPSPLPSDLLGPAPAPSDTAIFSPRLSPEVTTATPTPAPRPTQSAPTRDRQSPVTLAKPSAPPKSPAPSTATQPTAQSAIKPPLPAPSAQPNRATSTAIAPTPAVTPVSKPLPEPQPPAVPVVAEPIETAPVAPVQPEVKPTANLPRPTPDLETAVLPPANFRSQQSVTVSVPPMNSTAGSVQVPQLGDRVPTTTINTEPNPGLPPAVFTPQPSATVTVPSLSSPSIQPAPTRAVTLESPQLARTPNVDEAAGRVIEFGQPLAATSSTPAAATPPNLPTLESETDLPTETPSVISARATAPVTVPPLPRSTANSSSTELDFQRPSDLPSKSQPNIEAESSNLVAVGDGIVLPTGTTLQLQYSGTEVLELRPGAPQQEVLLLQTEIRDRNGSILAPNGAPVIGRFETTSGGSRFVAQAINLQGRNVPLAAESALLGGKLKVSQDKVVRNSALGALAGALVGGLSGEEVIGGAAAGAAVTYLASPKPAKLQPGQVLQVRLTEVLRSP
ncbi:MULTISPECIES: AMIN domain-containing protein [Trichocoleus]|uniref:AMIN domain-containing protein n=1 Tax=Trichocoleus desertorum GB2-A4 TaxID=2933944 RepID=A0ABV0JE81_9CYAN|nr:AMIN domain-containing protein [Trichocoleus sp. FACHB-46]MBD1862701.1 AMIN domain-containing protein [Trichocoleus sp. FACHB-46]